MLLLLSPAKTIEPAAARPALALSRPLFIQEANYLASLLKKRKQDELAKLFQVNRKLAEVNYARYQFWKTDPDQWEPHAALLSFKGEVFRGLEAWTLPEDALTYAQDRVRILSGLYGMIRPLDIMQPYRLEMGTPLENKAGLNLYAFWKEKLTRTLLADLENSPAPAVINLASKEYSQVVDWKKVKAPVYQLDFKDYKDGSYRFLTVYGKHARGKMTRFILQNRIEQPDELKAFDADGYSFNPRLSKEYHLVFTRG